MRPIDTVCDEGRPSADGRRRPPRWASRVGNDGHGFWSVQGTPARICRPWDRTLGRDTPRRLRHRRRWVSGLQGAKGVDTALGGARTKEPQALVRISGTGEPRRESSGRRNGFIDGRMPVGRVSAKARYPLTITVVVRPVAGAANTGAGRLC